MGLNINNEETYRLVRELASLTGQSMTDAVTDAVREQLKRVHERQSGGLVERLLAIGKDCAAHLEEPYRSIDHADLLYDDHGLPQ